MKMNKELERKMRWIEQRICELTSPRIARNDSQGQGRSILQNSLVKEAKNLYEKIAEAQFLINQLKDSNDQAIWQNHLNLLETARQEIVSPQMIIHEEMR